MTDQPIEQNNDEDLSVGGDAPDLTPNDDHPGQERGAPATGGEGSQGAGGPAGFGTAD